MYTAIVSLKRSNAMKNFFKKNNQESGASSYSRIIIRLRIK